MVKKSVVLMDLTHTGGKEGERRRWAGHPNSPTVDDNIERQRKATLTQNGEGRGQIRVGVEDGLNTNGSSTRALPVLLAVLMS